MEKVITLTLNAMDVGQVLDGLEQRRIIWQATAEYLENGSTDLSDFIEECSDAEEAQAVAEHYQRIMDTIRKQRESQIDRKKARD